MRSCCLGVDRREGAAHACADRRGLAAAGVTLPGGYWVLLRRNALVRTVPGRRNSRCPDYTASATSWCRRYQTAEPAPGFQNGCRCNRPRRSPASSRRIAARSHRRPGTAASPRFSAAVPAAPAFLRCHKRFSIGAVEDVDPTGATGFRDAFSRLAVDHGVEQHDRARGIVVPEIVVHLLEVPGVFAGLGLQGHHGRAEQIVTARIEPS